MTPDPYLPAGVRPFTVDELVELAREGRPAAEPERWTRPFVAKLLPIGETVGPNDPRMLSVGGQWSVEAGAPVFAAVGHQAPTVGRITGVWVEEWALMARGFIDPAIDLDQVKPQVEFLRHDSGPGPTPGTWNLLVFRSAEIGSIVLGTTPAFPGAWIRHDDDFEVDQ